MPSINPYNKNPFILFLFISIVTVAQTFWLKDVSAQFQNLPDQIQQGPPLFTPRRGLKGSVGRRRKQGFQQRNVFLDVLVILHI